MVIPVKKMKVIFDHLLILKNASIFLVRIKIQKNVNFAKFLEFIPKILLYLQCDVE